MRIKRQNRGIQWMRNANEEAGEKSYFCDPVFPGRSLLL